MGQLVSGGMQLAGGIISGNAAQAQGIARAGEIKRDADLAKTAATESMASRLEDLQRTVGAIRSLAGQRGLDPNDPSSMAATDAAGRYTYRDNQRTAFNSAQNYSNAQLAARAAKMAGNAALWSNYLSATGSFIQSTDKAIASASSGGGGG